MKAKRETSRKPKRTNAENSSKHLHATRQPKLPPRMLIPPHSPHSPYRSPGPSSTPAPARPAPSPSTPPSAAPSSPPSSIPSTPEHLRNNHIPLLPTHPLIVQPPPHADHAPVEEFLLSKALSPNTVKFPTSLLRRLNSPKDWLGEVLYILRPLIYGAHTSSLFRTPILMHCV